MKLVAPTWRDQLNHLWLRARVSQTGPLHSRHAGSHMLGDVFKVTVSIWFILCCRRFLEKDQAEVKVWNTRECLLRLWKQACQQFVQQISKARLVDLDGCLPKGRLLTPFGGLRLSNSHEEYFLFLSHWVHFACLWQIPSSFWCFVTVELIYTQIQREQTQPQFNSRLHNER